MATKVPAYLIEIFEEAVANNNYNIDELYEKPEKLKKLSAKAKEINDTRKPIKK